MDEIAKLIHENNALDFGLGRPECMDLGPPSHMLESLKELISSGDCNVHQTQPSKGDYGLLNRLSEIYSKLLGKCIDPETELLVTSGATEGIYLAFLTVLNTSDEVIVIEPAYELYEQCINLANAVQRNVQLRPNGNELVLDLDELQSVFNPKTKMIVLNNPHNPSGKLFTEDELRAISKLCCEYNVICLSDEVYEFLIIDDDSKHARINQFEGMFERTITFGSAAKAFGVTGWRVGWAYGPERYIKKMKERHLVTVYAVPTPLQRAIAEAFRQETRLMGSPNSYWTKLNQKLLIKRNRITSILESHGFEVVRPSAGYFILCDASGVWEQVKPADSSEGNCHLDFVTWFCKNVGVGVIPVSCFYGNQDERVLENYIRLSFMMSDKTLDKLSQKLDNYFSNHSGVKNL